MDNAWVGSLVTLGVLATLWASWTEYRLRKTQAELRKVKNEKQDLQIKEAVSKLTDADLNNKLHDALTGTSTTKPTT